MGLTIHYGLTSTTRSSDRAKKLVEQMRQQALDLPFESVDSEVTYLGPDVCQTPLDDLRSDDAVFSTVLDGCKHIPVPWHKKQCASVTVQPLEVISFWTVPGLGSEWAGFGLARYPSEIEVTYTPKSDDKFIKTVKDGGCTRWEFDWRKWERWLRRSENAGFYVPPELFEETRKIKTRLASGWHYGSFCKTQYASNPECGGVANFVKCHLCVIHLLERIAKLPTIKVEIDDEGQYGPSYYTDDWRVPEPVYSWHEGQYDVKKLVEEVGDWNEMIAANFGALNDLLNSNGSSLGVESPISEFPNFERLEFNGRQQEHLKPFLQAMEQLAEKERKSTG